MVVGGELGVARARRAAADEAGQVARPRLALLLELAQPPVVALHLVPQLSVLHHRALVVELEAAHAVQPLQVQPALPPHAHAVEDERCSEVDLDIINKLIQILI